MRIIGCDIGGTEIKGALFDKGIIKESKHKTDQSLGRRSVMDTLVKVINDCMDSNVKAIGISTAGAIDVKTGMIVANAGTIKGWENFSIKEYIEELFNIPVYIDNDANGAMIAEMEKYLKQGVKNAVMITLGTGVGSAVYINGEIYRGSNYQVEFGHLTLYPNGRQCTCGLKGCAEAYLSGTALTKLGQEKINQNIKHGKEIFDYYREGDNQAKEVIDTYTNDLSVYLSSLNKVYDPEVFIIGGGVIHEKDILLEELNKKLTITKPIKPAQFGNFAGIKGAYLLALKGQTNE